MRLRAKTITRRLAPALALLALVGCDSRTEPSASPSSSAPRDWSVRQKQETGAPTPDTPKQHAPNQGGDPGSIRSDRPAQPDPTTR